MWKIGLLPPLEKCSELSIYDIHSYRTASSPGAWYLETGPRDRTASPVLHAFTCVPVYSLEAPYLYPTPVTECKESKGFHSSAIYKETTPRQPLPLWLHALPFCLLLSLRSAHPTWKSSSPSPPSSAWVSRLPESIPWLCSPISPRASPGQHGSLLTMLMPLRIPFPPCCSSRRCSLAWISQKVRSLPFPWRHPKCLA